MTRERETGAQQSLSHADDEIERPDEHAVAEQGAGDGRRAIERVRRSDSVYTHDDTPVDEIALDSKIVYQ